MKRIIKWFKHHRIYFCYNCRQIKVGDYYIIWKEKYESSPALTLTKWCPKCYDYVFEDEGI